MITTISLIFFFGAFALNAVVNSAILAAVMAIAAAVACVGLIIEGWAGRRVLPPQ